MYNKKHSIFSYIFFIALAVGFGLSVSYSLVKTAEFALSNKKIDLAEVINIADNLMANATLVYVSKPAAPSPVLVATSTVASSTIATSTITLSFVGDIMLDRGVEQSVIKNGAGDYNWLFKNVEALKNSDIVFGNLEGPVSDRGADLGNQYSFRMDPKILPVLVKNNFTILSQANNHMGDWGRDAFADSLKKIKDAGLQYVGAGTNVVDAEAPKIIEKKGVKFGYLGFSDVGPTWLAVASTSAGVLLASNPRLSEIVKNASEKVDVLVVSFHFGNEYEKTANDRQRALAHLAIASGAKIVVGHHPHVAQEMEKYKDGVIFYSLGNFIFDQNFSPETMSGQLAQVEFDGKNIVNISTKKTQQNNLFQVSVE